MARNGITPEEVFATADGISQAGDVVSVKKVRERLGDRGSYSTISRHLREWERARGIDVDHDNRPPASVERDALRFVQSLWRALLGAVPRNGGASKARLHQLDHEIDHSRQSIQTVEQRCAVAARELDRITAELAEKQRELQSLESELAASEQRLDALQRHEAELEQRVASLARSGGAS
jgi:hypothetical protein